MEVADGVLAVLIRKAMLIGSDSKSIVDNSALRINEAKAADERAEAQDFRPTNKPWEMQQECDLWECVWKCLRSRGPNSVAIGKV